MPSPLFIIETTEISMNYGTTFDSTKESLQDFIKGIKSSKTHNCRIFSTDGFGTTKAALVKRLLGVEN